MEVTGTTGDEIRHASDLDPVLPGMPGLGGAMGGAADGRCNGLMVVFSFRMNSTRKKRHHWKIFRDNHWRCRKCCE